MNKTRQVRTEGEYCQITQLEEFWWKGFDFVVRQKDHKSMRSGPGGGDALGEERSMRRGEHRWRCGLHALERALSRLCYDPEAIELYNGWRYKGQPRVS